jgi:outer membrane protein assembly factor BamD (BamD/ComL family)
MKQVLISTIFAFILAAGFAGQTYAQKNVTPAIDRDPLLEQDAKHNLDVAWQAFLLKKAYKGVILRFDETFAAYPDFSKMDEFLYIAGVSSYRLSENKGKQKVDLKSAKEKDRFAPAKLRDDAVAYLTMVMDKYPQSKYVDDAKKTLNELRTLK